MGLSFLNPALLFGALAASVPVIIHLIYRRRALVHRFPAVRFLLLADKRTARKFRLHQWLLLALRVLAILLLVLIMARPRLLGGDVHAAADLPPQALLVLLDNSLSMQYHDGQETRWQRAIALATRLVHETRPQDSAAVMPLLTAADTTAFFTADRASLQAQIDAIQPGHATVDLAAAFQRAFALLGEQPAARRRLVFLSDFTVHGWEEFHPQQLGLVPERLELHFMRLGHAERDANVLVEAIRIVEAPFIEGIPLEATVLVRNRSTEPVRNLRIDLLTGQSKVGEQLVDLAPLEQVTVPFRFTAPAAGVHWGEVRIENDRYTDDDRLYFAMRTAKPVHALVVDGDPGASLYESELFYLMSVLSPGRVLGHALFYAKPIPWEGLANEALSAYQIVILCNVEALAPQVRQRLHQFVLEGGGLLMFAGNRVQDTRYNAMFYHADTALLPLALQQPVHRPEQQPASIEHIDRAHAALSVFSEDASLLHHGQFYRYIGMQPPPDGSGAQVLLSLQDGHPLLVEKRLGRGKVLFFASSADRDWTDLPTRTAYVPLLHGMLGYLAHLGSATQRPATVLPEAVSIPGRKDDLDTSITVQTPDGQTRPSRYVADGDEVAAHFADYTVPGIYRLSLASGTDLLAVNATRAESDFAKLPQADLLTRWRPLQVVFAEEEDGEHSLAALQRPMWELSGILIFILIASLITENIYANRL